MKTKTIIIVVVILALLGFAYWFFIGGALTTQRVDEVLPTTVTVLERQDFVGANSEVIEIEVPTATVLKQGEFTEIDSVHKGSGVAKVIEQDGKYFLTLEDFKVTNGPDLFVYLSKNKDITKKAELGEFKNLQALKGNEGNQVYEISKEDADNFESVVIWCKRFGVLFSSATLV